MPESKKKTRRLSHEQVGMIRGLWEQGIMSKPDIAQEIGCSTDQVKYQIEKNGWVQGARADYYEELAVKAIEEQLGEQAKKLAVAKESARDKAIQLSNVVEARLIKAIKDGDAKGLTDAALQNDYKSLEIASRIVQNTFHTKRFALGMDKDEPVSEDYNNQIELLEMSAEEVDDIKRSQEEQAALMDVVPDEDEV